MKLSLTTRFLFWIVLLLTLLVGMILFVIQRKEVQTIIQETRNRSILTAQYIANLNLRALVFWDEEALLSNVESQADDKLVYIVFYDRNGKPRAANRLVAGLPEIVDESHLKGDGAPDDYVIETRAVRITNRMLNILEIELPIFVTGSPTKWASIKIGHSLEEMYAEVRKTRGVLIMIGLVVLMIGILGSALLIRRATQPLKELAEGTVRIANGDFSHRIRMTRKDEVGDLARSFNEMTGQLLQARERMAAANRKLVQAEKLASIGRLAATIAHEIRNPLTSVKLNIQRIAENESLNDIEREHLGITQEGIGQIEKFIKELLNFTRVSELNRDRFPIEQILDESIKILKDTFQQKNLALQKDYAGHLPPAYVDADKMRQVFLNILRNAYEAVDEGGEIRISADLKGGNGEKRLVVEISDNGCGISAKDRENIFEPFFSTKVSGFGLGLANARKIVEQHNGSIKAVMKKGQGSAFVVTLPCKEGT